MACSGLLYLISVQGAREETESKLIGIKKKMNESGLIRINWESNENAQRRGWGSKNVGNEKEKKKQSKKYRYELIDKLNRDQ